MGLWKCDPNWIGIYSDCMLGRPMKLNPDDFSH